MGNRSVGRARGRAPHLVLGTDPRGLDGAVVVWCGLHEWLLALGRRRGRLHSLVAAQRESVRLSSASQYAFRLTKIAVIARGTID